MTLFDENKEAREKADKLKVDIQALQEKLATFQSAKAPVSAVRHVVFAAFFSCFG